MRIFCIALLAIGLSACGGGDQPTEPAVIEKPAVKPEPKIVDATMKAKIEKPAKVPFDESKYSAELLDPSKADLTAPDTYKVKLETTKGDVVIEVTRAWAPNGADRFYNMVKAGFYDDRIAFFRAIDGFMVQFGIHGEPEIGKRWREARIKDDAVEKSNTRAMVTFATAGPDTRTTQIFVNYADKNKMLDSQGFSPFGKVTDEGMADIDSLYKGYGEGAPRGRGPHQGKLQQGGNAYLQQKFPKLDYIEKATIIE